MPKLTGNDAFDVRLRKVMIGLRSLEGTADRPIARRNARRRALQALASLRLSMDEQFPAIVSRAGVKRLTVEGRIARLKRAGWVETGPAQAVHYAAAGVSVRTVRREPAGTPSIIFVPRWAQVIGCTNPTKLRAAKKSAAVRNAVLAAHALVNTAA